MYTYIGTMYWRGKKDGVDIRRRVWKRILEIRNQGGTVELRWIRSHQRARRGETYEEAINREGNDAADEYATAMCARHLPDKRVLKHVELHRKYVKETLTAAARISIEQSAETVRLDTTPRAEPDKVAKVAKVGVGPRKPETIQERAIRRKIVTLDQDTRQKNTPKRDPYEGHGVEPDELQIN